MLAGAEPTGVLGTEGHQGLRSGRRRPVLAKVIASGTMSARWWSNQRPVRPMPVWISSTTSRAPAARDLPCRFEVCRVERSHPGLALDRFQDNGAGGFVDRRAQGIDVARWHESDPGRSGAKGCR